MEHEVLPVASGHRLTLTYDVFCQPDARLTGLPADATATPIGAALKAALNNTSWFPNGVVLGFALGHLYPKHTSRAFSPATLKGADASLVAAARQLQLKVVLEPVWQAELADFCWAAELGSCPEDCGCADCCRGRPGVIPSSLAVGGPFAFETVKGFHGDAGETDTLTKLGGPKRSGARRPRAPWGDVVGPDHIFWVSADFDMQKAKQGMGWGNEPFLEFIYSAAAAIITVPPVPQRKYS